MICKRMPRIVRFIKGKQRWFKAAGKVVEMSDATREGGPISKLLGSAIATSEIVNIFYPSDSPWSYFGNRGYQSIDTAIDGFVCELLMSSNLERQLVAASLTDQAYVFTSGNINIGAIFSGDKYSGGPYLENGKFEDIVGILQEIVWEKDSSLMLSAKENDHYSYRGSNKFGVNPGQEPGPFLGMVHNPESFAKRLARYGREPRTVLLRGPTGVGKSVFAKHVASYSAGHNAKTLKIASSVLGNCSFEQLIAMVHLFKPTVLLLDDLSLSNTEKTEGFLSLLEALRDPECLVIATVMTSSADDPDKEPKIGDWHFPGMRPGRVDEVLTFHLPNEEERNLILRYYLGKNTEEVIPHWDEIIKLTDQLSGAYLGEVARRLVVHGFGNWEQEIKSILYTSPKNGEEESNDKSPKDDSSDTPCTAETPA